MNKEQVEVTRRALAVYGEWCRMIGHPDDHHALVALMAFDEALNDCGKRLVSYIPVDLEDHSKPLPPGNER